LTESSQKSKSRKPLWAMLILILALFLVQWGLSHYKQNKLEELHQSDSLKALVGQQVDSLRRLDSLQRIASQGFADSAHVADSLQWSKDSLALRIGHSKGEFEKLWKAYKDSVAAVRGKQHVRDSLQNLGNKTAMTDAERLAYALKHLGSATAADSQRVADSLRLLKGRSKGEFDKVWKAYKDSVQHAKDSAAYALSERLSKERQDSLRIADSLIHFADSVHHADSTLYALRHSNRTPPEGQILPPPGRYYQEIAVRAVCKEAKCQSFISKGDTNHRQPGTTPIALKKSDKLYWRLVDSVGNKSSWQLAEYDMASDSRCPANSYPVPVKGKTVCVDAFEYPNHPDEVAKDMVTQDEAVRLCAKDGKHLCTLDEWQTACKGKDNLKYPYGNKYDETRCVTAETKADRSGRREGCRSWWGMQDMAGNLWEWTATPNPKRPTYFFVAGGSWNTHDESACSSTKFSFFPQNQYPFVGFRCCSELK